MSEETPAALLRRAAQYLRALVEAAPDGPWFLDHEEAERQEENADDPWFRKEYADDREWRVGCWGPDFGGGAHMSGFFVADELNLGFAHLAASMGPQTAAPLAVLLDTIAEHTETGAAARRESGAVSSPAVDVAGQLLNIARAVLP